MKPTDPSISPLSSSDAAAAFSPRRRSGLLIAVVLFAVLLGVAFLYVRHGRQQQFAALAKESSAQSGQATAVNAVKVALDKGSGALRLPGSTAALYDSTLYSRVNGYVEHWTADIGDTVRAGQVLATLSTPDLDAELAAAQARIQADQAEVQVRKSALAFANTTEQRWREAPAGVVAEQERESKKADLDGARAQVVAAEARVNLDRADVTRLTALSDFKLVKAPFAGVITERHIDIGNLVTAGSTAATAPLYRLAQDQTVRVFVDVPQALADQLPVGTMGSILVQESGHAPVAARITRTARAIDSSARTLRVELDVANPSRQLLPGQYVQVEFSIHPPILPQVPAAAVMFRSAGARVAIIDATGKVHFQPVTIARDEGSLVSISQGLVGGEQVALNLGSQVAEGDHVVVQQ